MTTLAWIAPDDPPETFPPSEQALAEPDGLLAVGGDLSPARLLAAYRRGIFPWSTAEEPILWWSPDPRAVLFPETLHVPRRLQRILRRGDFSVSIDNCFGEVVAGCAAPRAGQQSGTWITTGMRDAFATLHAMGHAHSVEVWTGHTLVGGLYGLAIGRVFFAESMFSRARDASKVALVQLARMAREGKLALIDCQIASPHLMQFGCTLTPRARFLEALRRLTAKPPKLAWSRSEARSTAPWEPIPKTTD